MADEEAAEVAEPGEGAFDLPSAAEAAEFAFVLQGWADAALAVGANEFDVSAPESVAQAIGVIGAVDDELEAKGDVGLAAVQGALQQGHFGGRGGGKLACHRNTLAVDHHHPLRALAAFGGPHGSAPFWPGRRTRQQRLLSNPERTSGRANARNTSRASPTPPSPPSPSAVSNMLSVRGISSEGPSTWPPSSAPTRCPRKPPGHRIAVIPSAPAQAATPSPAPTARPSISALPRPSSLSILTTVQAQSFETASSTVDLLISRHMKKPIRIIGGILSQSACHSTWPCHIT